MLKSDIFGCDKIFIFHSTCTMHAPAACMHARAISRAISARDISCIDITMRSTITSTAKNANSATLNYAYAWLKAADCRLSTADLWLNLWLNGG